jgi:hypothetical protein
MALARVVMASPVFWQQKPPRLFRDGLHCCLLICARQRYGFVGTGFDRLNLKVPAT